MGTLKFGAEQAIHKCLRLHRDEEIVLITDHETSDVSDALMEQINGVTSHVKRFVMEDFGDRPEDGSVPLVFPAVIAEAYETVTASIYAAAGKRGELKSFRIPMLDIVDAKPDLRHAHMPSVTRQIMETGMAADYDVVQRLSKKVYDIVHKASAIRVTSAAGTDFTAHFNPGWRWIISDGLITPEEWKNLPDGEVFTCAQSVTGHAVVDGCLGDYLSKEGSCESFPVLVDMADGIITHISCPARPDIDAELRKYIAQDENANRIGEFAIGTNIGLDRIIGNLLQDEKFPGVHIAFGHGYPEKTGSPWKSDAHLDVVMRRVSITVDGMPIMRDGEFLIL